MHVDSLAAENSQLSAWVPASVQKIGLVIPCLAEVRSRLLHDARMKAVWRELARCTPNPEYLARIDSWRTLGAWGLDDQSSQSVEAASAALFAFAAVNFSRQAPIWTEAQKKESSEQFSKAAELCRSLSTDAMMASAEEQAALHLCSAFFERMTQTVDDLTGPFVLDRDAKLRGESQIRVQTREIADEVRKLFGRFLYGTVATIITVGLEPSKTITRKTVENWCASLQS